MQRIVSVSAEIPLSIKVLRDGGEVNLTATPALREVDDRLGGTQRIGLLGIQRSTSEDAIIHKSFGQLVQSLRGLVKPATWLNAR